MFNKIPLILLTVTLVSLAFAQYIPHEVKILFYTISVTIKLCLMILLPAIIFGIFYRSTVAITSRTTQAILLLLSFIFCSDFITAIIHNHIGAWLYAGGALPFVMSIAGSPTHETYLALEWLIDIQDLIAYDKAMFLGIAAGAFASIYDKTLADSISKTLFCVGSKALHGSTYVIPVVVAGLVLELDHDSVLLALTEDYAIFDPVFTCATIIENVGFDIPFEGIIGNLRRDEVT